jgi:hypothetical protein
MIIQSSGATTGITIAMADTVREEEKYKELHIERLLKVNQNQLLHHQFI